MSIVSQIYNAGLIQLINITFTFNIHLIMNINFDRSSHYYFGK